MKERNSVILPGMENKKPVIFGAAAILGLLYYLPWFMLDGIPHYFQEDTYFHTSRIVGLRNVWSSPINFLTFAHNGPAVNIFYPWLTMYPMYVFSRLTGSYVLGYKLYYWCLTVLTLLIAYCVMKRISKSELSAAVFAVLYTYSAYRLINVFRRAHLGESICMTGMLLVLGGLYEIFFGDRKRWKFLALGMAILAYSHNTFLVIASISCGLMVLLSIWKADEKKERFLSFIKAAAAAVLFFLGSFLPMLEYSAKNELYTPGGSGLGLRSSAYSLFENINSSLRNEPVSFAVGFIVVMALCGLILFYILCAAHVIRIKRNRGMDLFALLGIGVFLCETSLLPWQFIGDHTPLYIIQFVWRLNSQSTIFILAPFAYYLGKVLRSRKSALISFGIVCILALGLNYSALLKLHREENVRIFEKDIAAGDAITFDYTPLQAKRFRDNNGYTLDDLYLNGEVYEAEISYSADGTAYMAVIDGPDETSLTADLPVFWYENQICTLNGEAIQTNLSERGTTLVELQPGVKNEITISYRHTWLTWAAWTLSFAAFLLICLPRKAKSAS